MAPALLARYEATWCFKYSGFHSKPSIFYIKARQAEGAKTGLSRPRVQGMVAVIETARLHTSQTLMRFSFWSSWLPR